MNHFKTGVHTIEFQSTEYLKLSALPKKYAGAVNQVEGKRYKLTLPKVQDVPEYSSPADTQQDIEAAFAAFAKTGAYCRVTRIDYRLDDHSGAYADNLQLMTIAVNLIAAMGDVFGRRVFYTDGNGIITSVRCMPDKKDHDARYGAEYYDKPKQAKTDEYGNARFELRRLNLNGECVQYVVKEWRDMLQSITRAKYVAMLEAHARSLQSSKQPGEDDKQFTARTKRQLIAQEEWNEYCKLNGRHPNHYRENVGHLPAWEDVKPFLDDLTAHLSEALMQPPSSLEHPNTVNDECPF